MDALSALPVWVQLVLGVLAAVVLVVLNAGWLLAAKGQIDARKRQYAAGQQTAQDRPQTPPRP